MNELTEFATGVLLASASPRRRSLLEGVALPVCVRPVDVDETPFDNEQPLPYVTRVARAKGEAARARDSGWLAGGAQRVLLAADTTVEIDDLILGKPGTVQEARAMLKRLSGRRHRVLTAVYAATAQTVLEQVDASLIEFRVLADAEIEAYIATGEPFDKAGAYGIQGLGGTFVCWQSGTFSGVAGLPLARVEAMLIELGLDPWALRQTGSNHE